jgi:cholesterol oxidase
MAKSKKQNQKSDKKCSRRSVLKATVAGATLVGLGKKSKADDDPIQLSEAGGKRCKPCVSELKVIAKNDYQHSLKRYGGRLSNSIRNLFVTAEKQDQVHFAVTVIGSGYGASIMAARLSKALRDDTRICILERGKEWMPGSFPDTFENTWRNTRQQMTGPTRGQVVNPLGLFDISFNKEINILSGSALGGTSNINASVAVRPEPEVFQQSRWPSALRDVHYLEPYYNRAARELSLTRSGFDATPKIRSRRQAAERMSSDPRFFDLSPLSVMYDYRHLDQQVRNRQGMIQRPCTNCGDCITGCNVGAKNTLSHNYLPIAKWNGTEMYTQVNVDSIEKRQGYYRINLTYIDDSNHEITHHKVSINSKIVVVGAGSPGSAKVLMNSQNETFEFSQSLGQNWSANGDAIGFVLNTPQPSHIGGHGTCPSQYGPVGPTVQTTTNFFQGPNLQDRFIIQEAAIPRGVVNLFQPLMKDQDLTNTMVMLAMGHDEARGKVVWKDGRYQIDWPGLKESPYRLNMFKVFEDFAQAHGGKYKRLKLFGSNLVTVHPLGACGMSDSPEAGTVNQFGQVYEGKQGGCVDPRTGMPQVHEGLYVADASVIPTPIGVNPYMTISALSERIAEHLIGNPQYANLFQAKAPAMARS